MSLCLRGYVPVPICVNLCNLWTVPSYHPYHPFHLWTRDLVLGGGKPRPYSHNCFVSLCLCGYVFVPICGDLRNLWIRNPYTVSMNVRSTWLNIRMPTTSTARVNPAL